MPKPWKAKTWLLFIYKVPSEPSRKRTFVWRKLTRMRSLYLQQAVCLLPDTEANASELESLALRIREFDGEATLLRVLAKNEDWERDILGRLEANRGARYKKLQEEVKKFVEEIHFEEHRKRFTLEELEELEEKLETLRRWFEKIKQEDSGGSHLSQQTKTSLKDASDLLDLFAEKVEKFQKDSKSQSPLKRIRKKLGMKERVR